MHDVRGLSDTEWVSDELDSGPDSEDDDDSIRRTLFPTFSMPKSLTDYKWENDKKRVAVKCLGSQGKCKWYAYCAYRSAAKSWQLRKVIDDHSCSTVCNVKLMTSKWLSQRMVKFVKENPNMKVMDIRDKVSRKWNVGISRNMAFRVRVMAKDNVEGSFKEQYRRIYDYGHELLRANPGSTVKIKVENSNEECIFNRIYVCLKACKDSFISCRPIIGLDGCFLKGKYGGELLTAIGRYGNEQILPIAYVVVEGLLPAIQDLLPGVDQRFCVRHLYSNFRKKFPGKDLKHMMWRAATTTYPQLWEAEMRKIKEINVDAFKYLIVIPPRFWSRSRFSPRSQSDTLVNNMCEGFNSVLVSSRCKPLINMLEDIRVYIMKRWATNRTKMGLYQGSVCPKVLNKFEKQSWLTRYWLPRWSSNQLFEVLHISQFGEQFVVNIENKDSSCRKWLITGIPCTHAITAMKCLNLNAEDYIGHWFRKSTYEETYNTIIYLINGQLVWDITSYPDVLPPKKKTMPGRPKKK
ncbi:uncharacterized protein LOC108327733 [Vigna angularis]|uniref:uncharacterized protein LOC108327733 n=1 Tax=Phaseolus angularis TaxID=3914 RepID=UPI000809B89C|nr:uncharacterized protein LOC108327733 [Vigna angularis]